jgi:hypothetical protein
MSQSENARLAASPWRQGAMIRPKAHNADRQKAARKRMSDFEVSTGRTVESFLEDMAAQRERVRKRYGLS